MVFQDMRQIPIFSSFSEDELADLKLQGSEIVLKTGDVLFFHGRTVHWGNEAPINRKRHSYACHFMRADAVLDQSNNSVFLEPIPLAFPGNGR